MAPVSVALSSSGLSSGATRRLTLCLSPVCAGNAIVYGSSLDVFITVETLLSLGVQGRRIHLLLTAPEPAVSSFSDPAVQKAVETSLEKAEVRVHRHCLLAQMNHGEEQLDLLTSVSFTTDAAPLHLQCGVSFRWFPASSGWFRCSPS